MSDPKCVRFELELSTGAILRLTGDAAEEHCQRLNAGCAYAHVHGWTGSPPPPFDVFVIQQPAPPVDPAPAETPGA